MNIQKIDPTESSILELEKVLQGIGKEVVNKKKNALKANDDALNMLKTTKKLQRNWV